MNKKLSVTLLLTALLAGCASSSAPNTANSDVLGDTHWQGTVVYDANGKDLTAPNSGFIGLAKYDQQSGRYEFFDKKLVKRVVIMDFISSPTTTKNGFYYHKPRTTTSSSS